MKKGFILVLCAFCCFAAFAQGLAESQELKVTVENELVGFEPQTMEEKYFYAMGNYIYGNYAMYYEDMDPVAFAAGVIAYAQTGLLDEALVNEYVEAYNQKWMAGIAADNLAAAEAFLEENAKADGVITTASGLQYMVLEEGTGSKPQDGDTVDVDYELTLLNGMVVDSSYDRGESAQFGLGDIIPGFAEGLKLMPEGSTYRFWIHPSLGYGEDGNSAIEPNSLLIFDVELHSIVK